MPPRLRLRSLKQLVDLNTQRAAFVCARCQYATAAATPSATATTTTPPPADMTIDIPPMQRYSSLQPPSHRDPKYRKSQLLRSYVSLLESTPLIVLFQHNNLKAMEWASIRRELAVALQKADDTLQSQNANAANLIADSIKLQVVQTNILEPALRITEYYKPSVSNTVDMTTGSSNASSTSSPPPPVPATFDHENLDPSLTHALSSSAYTVSQANRNIHPLTPLLTGNIALLTFPSVSPVHLKAALSIVSPQAPAFPAPTRRAAPSYHEPPVQDGLKKLMLLGARVDGQIFDMEGVRWIGGIDGGIDGLRAQVVGMLQGFGAGLAQTLEGASRSLWFTVEGRRKMLEEEANGGEGKQGAEAQKES